LERECAMVELKILNVVGCRPNFIKLAPLLVEMKKHAQISPLIVHTGQHYDEAMSGSFFAELGLPRPDIDLAVGSASHAVQTAEIMQRFEAVLLKERPDAVVVVGDVNSTVACALVAAKLSLDSSGRRPLIAHVEAGLRSFDRDMPEEINRIVTDHLSDLLFVTEVSGIRNLRREGIPEEKIHFVGNTMIDSLLASKEKADTSTILSEYGLRKNRVADGAFSGITPYAVLTLHRPANVDHLDTFLGILTGLSELSACCPVLFAAHPRTRRRITEFGIERLFRLPRGVGDTASVNCAAHGIHLLGPLGYLDFLCLMTHATLVVTDSGGIQEETTCLGIPCVTVRKSTERPVTVECGTNVVAGTDSENIRRAVKEQATRRACVRVPDKWDGQAGTRIVEALALELQCRNATRACSMTPQHFPSDHRR